MHYNYGMSKLTIALAGLAGLVIVAVAALILIPSLSSGTASPQASAAPAAFALSSLNPLPDASGVAPNHPITVSFSGSISASSPRPTLSPATPGSWRIVHGNEFVFTPTASLVPGTEYSLTIPGGQGIGVTGIHGARLADSETSSFSVSKGSMLRFQQILASLDYLPYSFHAGTGTPAPGNLGVPQKGSFALRWTDTPATLEAGFSPGQWDVVTQGAMMAFEDVHQLPQTVTPTSSVWSALLAAYSAHQTDPNEYTYIYVEKHPRPETLYLWEDGKVVLTSICNTGAGIDKTQPGTWPVFERKVSTTMRGIDANGQAYVAKDVPWVNFFHGSVAVHGYQRAAYGFPQSAGCVELPIPTAKVVYSYLHIGTLVTVLTSA